MCSALGLGNLASIVGVFSNLLVCDVAIVLKYETAVRMGGMNLGLEGLETFILYLKIDIVHDLSLL